MQDSLIQNFEYGHPNRTQGHRWIAPAHGTRSPLFGSDSKLAGPTFTTRVPFHRNESVLCEHARMYGHISPFTGFAEHLIGHLEVSYTKGFFGRISLDYFGEVLLLPLS